MKEGGRVPICLSVFCADHLRPAAKAAGVTIPDGHRWSLHNLRHSLSNWLVNKAKENPKTVQGILGHSRIQTTLDLYTEEDLDEMIAAQEKFLDAADLSLGAFSRSCGWDCGQEFSISRPITPLERVAGTTRLELATSAVTGQRSNQLNYVPTMYRTAVCWVSVDGAVPLSQRRTEGEARLKTV